MARVQIQVPVPTEETYGSTPPAHTKKQGGKGKKTLVISGAVLLILFIILALINLVNDRNKLKDQVDKLKTTQVTAESDTQKYGRLVSKLVVVPEGITPVPKTPTDQELADLTKDNPIYKSAKSGDVFLVYTLTDKNLFLVVYRPSTNQVVLATQGNQQASVPQTTTPTKK